MVGDRTVFVLVFQNNVLVCLEVIYRMLSINVPFLFENRVGKVICGHRLCAINRSKKSQYIIFSCIFSRFMLVSPAKILKVSVLSFYKF